MPLASDEIIVGQPPPADLHFHDWAFDDDFNFLDVDNSPDLNGTRRRWKRGFYAEGFKNLIWPDDSPYGHDQINRERQFYPGGKYPSPRGWTGLRLNTDGLCMRSRAVDRRSSLELARARVEGFEVNPDGSDGVFYGWVPMDYLSEMLSTYGRFSASFADFEFEGRIPYGAIGNTDDYTKMATVFPAFWLLEAIHAGRGIDGNLTGDGTTYMPAKLSLGGVLTEIDLAEQFGWVTDIIQQTLHFHILGNPLTQSDPHSIEVDFNTLYDWFKVRVIVTPELIGFYINDQCTLALTTPAEIADGMRVPTFEVEEPYTATGFTEDYQVHDGTTDRRYMQFCLIMNLARNAKLTNSQARQAYLGGYHMPAHLPNAEMFVRRVRVRPLRAESGNPDAYGMTVRGQFVATDSGGYEALTA